MRVTLIVPILLLIIGFANAEVAERTKEICEDLGFGPGIHFIPLEKNFTSAKEAEILFVKELNFTKFDLAHRPLDFYEPNCSGSPYTCYYPQLGIEIISGQGIIINCSHEGPTNEEAKKLWLEKHEEKIKRKNLALATGIGIFVAIGVFSFYIYTKTKVGEREKKIAKWIAYQSQKGYSMEQLKNYLLSYGYKKETIEKAVKYSQKLMKKK